MAAVSFERLRTARFARWVSSFALAAMLIALSAFLAHQHAAIQKAQGTEQGCELCLNLSTPAPTPADVNAVRLVPEAWQILPAHSPAPAGATPLHRYRSRAPPAA